MSEIIRKYIIISGTILLVLFVLGISWLCEFQWQFVFGFAYFAGIGNGMLIMGVINYDE